MMQTILPKFADYPQHLHALPHSEDIVYKKVNGV